MICHGGFRRRDVSELHIVVIEYGTLAALNDTVGVDGLTGVIGQVFSGLPGLFAERDELGKFGRVRGFDAFGLDDVEKSDNLF